MGVHFANPFGLSAGLDKNCEMSTLLDNAGFGFETVGSTTSRPCQGNARPWFHRLPEYDSMMVHVGLANLGSDEVIARAQQAWSKTKTMQMSVSIARTNDQLVGDLDEGIEDYCISMRRAAGRTAMVEVNISCPNTTVGEPFTADPNALDRLFTELDKIDRSPRSSRCRSTRRGPSSRSCSTCSPNTMCRASRSPTCRRTAPA